MVDEKEGHRNTLQIWFTKKIHDEVRARYQVRERKRKKDWENDRLITFSATIGNNLPCQKEKPLGSAGSAESAENPAYKLTENTLRELVQGKSGPEAFKNAETKSSEAKGLYTSMAAFFDAVCNKEYTAVSFMLETGIIGVNDKPEKALNTPLHYAAEMGDNKMVQLLLNKGATPSIANAQGSTALHIAALQGNKGMVHVLLAHRADPNRRDKNQQTPLMLGLLSRNRGVVELLLNHDAESGAFITSLFLYNFVVPGVSSPTITRRSVLSHAMQMDHCEEIVAMLLDHIDSSKDAYYDIVMDINNLLLEIAPIHGLSRNVESLLNRAETSRCRASVNHIDSDKETALMLACRSGNHNTVECLLRYMAKTDLKNVHGDDALYLATVSGSHRVVKLLLEHEEVEESKLMRCFETASFWAYEKVIQVLLDHWPNKNLPLKSEEAIKKLAIGMPLQESSQDNMRVLGAYLQLTNYSPMAKTKMDLWDRISSDEQEKHMAYWKRADQAGRGYVNVEEALKKLELSEHPRDEIKRLLRQVCKSERFLDQYDFVRVLRSIALSENNEIAFRQEDVMDVRRKLIVDVVKTISYP
eukprot:CAMPEP_0184707220 /NCGR_PEP_ID=MMETSP0313-20130426/37161_1 /TAXON_ID=2792 /ORGANISM="Porphyridium aerugineum, Strain SAG 1380-2" /LENGTH=585 /DNA_ID=CAMNT_0027168795 /DNA_START=255 /DNA_END=2013 /DNA_ORIENTATION=-